MKPGKRIVALLLTVLLMSALTACETKPDTPQDSHLDWVYVPEAANLGAVSENGYYYRHNGLLKYADFATGKSTVLCTKPGCKHEYDPLGVDICDADMTLLSSVFCFGDDTLYYLGRENLLCSRDATGGSMKELGTVAKELIDDGKSVEVWIRAVCNGYLYYSGVIEERKQDPSGGITTTASGYCIGRFNVAQRKDEILVLLEDVEYSENITLYAARENGVIYLYEEGIGPAEDWEDVDVMKRYEALQKMPIHIKHLNLATGETTTILTAKHGDVSSISNIENGKLIYRKNLQDGNSTFEVHSYDLVAGKDTVVFTDVAPLSLGKGYWQCTKWLDAKTAQRHIYDANTGKVLSYELKDNFGVVNQSEHGLVVLNSITGVFSFLSHDSLADGLQDTDLKYLYSNS